MFKYNVLQVFKVNIFFQILEMNDFDEEDFINCTEKGDE